MAAVSVVTLLYHSIYRDADTKESYDLDALLFECHLQAVRGAGLEFIAANNLSEAGNEASNNGEKLLLTFDDGKQDHCEIVLPILATQSLRGTFFVNPGRIGMSGYLDWTQLREMDRSGMSIQSHGLTHRYLHKLPQTELARELRESKLEIEQRIGRRVEFLSVPGGFYSKAVLESAWEHGFRGVFTSDPGADRIECPVQSAVLRRYNVTRATTCAEIARLLRRNWAACAGRQLFHGFKTGVRRALGTSAYHWCWTRLKKFVR